MSKDVIFLLGLAVGVAATVFVAWQIVSLAICILFLIKLATYYAAPVKMPPEGEAKFGEKEG